MPPTKLDKLKEQTKHHKPKDVYEQHTLAESDIIDAPRSKKQVENVRYSTKKKEHQPTEKRANFTDQIGQLQNMVQTHPLVQELIHTKGKIPSVVLFTKEQVLCLSAHCSHNSYEH